MITKQYFLSGEPFYKPSNLRQEYRFRAQDMYGDIGSITSHGYQPYDTLEYECNIIKADARGASCYTVVAGKLIRFRIKFSDYTETKPNN